MEEVREESERVGGRERERERRRERVSEEAEVRGRRGTTSRM